MSRTGALERPLVQRGYSAAYFLYERLIEARSTDAVLAHAEPGSAIIDVGANIGFFTVAFAERTGGSGLVIAFEPGTTNVAMLSRNVSRRRLGNVVVVHAALSDVSTMGKLDLNPRHPADHRIFSQDGERRAEVVRLVTLDDFPETTPLHGPISFVSL